jgi:hypothetical protein
MWPYVWQREIALEVTDAALDVVLFESYDPVSKIVTCFALIVVVILMSCFAYASTSGLEQFGNGAKYE